MTIARRYINAIRCGVFFQNGDDDAEAHDYAIGYAVRQTRHAQIDGRDWGPLSAKARRAVDAAAADGNHFDPDEAPRIPAETVTLHLADYERRTVAVVVAQSIRRRAA